jgi:hypothetical protein
MTATPHLLFAPRGGYDGVGEVLRTLALAKAARARWPEARVEFLAKPARVFENEAFMLHPVEQGISRDQAAAIDVLERTRPQVLVLDNHGRTQILAAAARLGTRTVFICDHDAFFGALFRSRRLWYIDQLWIVQRRFGQEAHVLPWHRRLRLALLPGPTVHEFDAILPEPEPAIGAELRREFELIDAPFALFVAGGGGYRHRGRPVSEIFAEAAEQVHAETGMTCVVVLGPLHPGLAPSPRGARVVESLPPERMSALLAAAEIVACGGGSMTSQALALGRPCVAAPTGGADQPLRIASCAANGLLEASPLEAPALADHVRGLVADPACRATMQRRIQACGFRNGLPDALGLLERISGATAEERDASA